jgi:hypothetical protein
LRAFRLGGSPELRNDPRWMVTRVCQTWRAAALSTPRLWARIELLPGSTDYTTERCVLHLLHRQMQLSGALPLALRWDAPAARLAISPEARRSIVDLFLSVAHRWQDIKFAVQDVDYMRLSETPDTFLSCNGFNSPVICCTTPREPASWPPRSYTTCKRLSIDPPTF